MHGLVENKSVLKFLLHNVGGHNKSSQNTLGISCSLKTLHNFVKTENLKITSSLKGIEKAQSFARRDFALAS